MFYFSANPFRVNRHSPPTPSARLAMSFGR
jgi:hypothetical protein